jgi:hypothetical protein
MNSADTVSLQRDGERIMRSVEVSVEMVVLDGSHADADGVLDQFGRALHAQALHDAGLVELCGATRDVEDARDFLGRATFGDELKDFPLAWCEFT